MKTTTNFIPRKRLRLPTLALLFTAILLPFLVPRPVQAQSEKLFSANFITRFTSVVEGNFLHVTVTGPGRGTFLDRSQAFTDSQFVSLIDGSITATYTLTGASGDTLTLDFVAQGTNVDGGATFAGSYTITGGTGQFAGASGSGALVGGALFLSETDGIGVFAIAGTISH